MLSRDLFIPRGGTALIDAACLAIDATGNRLAAMPPAERPDKVLFIIVTDGLENASKFYTCQSLNIRISHQRAKYNWQFIFLGANQDVIAEATKYGIPIASAFSYQPTDDGISKAYTILHGATRNWKLDGNTTAEDLLTNATPEIKIAVTVKN